MEIRQALENIKRVTDELPEAEVSCIRAHREEAIPTLLEYVKTAADLGIDLPEDYHAHILAMFLLAEFRVNEAFPYLIRYLEFDEKFVIRLIGDSICEDFGQIIASVAQAHDIPRIQEVAENEDLYSIQRLAAAIALHILCLEGVYSRENYFAYLGKLLEYTDVSFLSFVAIQCADAGARELLPRIKNLYENGQIDSQIIRHKEIVEKFDRRDKGIGPEKLKADSYYTRINDTIDWIRGWSCYREKRYERPRKKPYEELRYVTESVSSAPKVGRNNPCPCGSGKKYKKCCGK